MPWNAEFVGDELPRFGGFGFFAGYEDGGLVRGDFGGEGAGE